MLSLDVYSHGVRIYGYSRETFRHLAYFLENLALKEPRKLPPNQGGHMVMELKKRFYGLRENRRETFIHRHHLDDLLRFLEQRGISKEYIQINQIPVPQAKAIDFTIYDFFTFDGREYQIPIIDKLSDPHYSRRLDLQTGKGKTHCALSAVANLGQRTVVMLAPKYFGLWVKALNDTYVGYKDDTTGKVATVSGSSELKLVIDLALRDELNAEVLLVSNTTYRAYIETYEKFGEAMMDMGWGCPPPRFHEALGAGIQINDEYQDDPGLAFRTDVFTNVAKQIYLSATPYTGSDYVTKMIDVMLPEETQCPLPEYDAYIDVISLYYNDPGVQSKDFLTPFKNTYNHARYEKQMMKKKKRLETYQSKVARVANGIFVQDMQKGQKLLILCATVDFIHLMVKYLNVKFPNLRVGAYVAGTPYENVLKQDITVSTIKSAGTGVDIPNLRETLLLQATDSKKDNIQILGRLRKLKDYPDLTPRLTYMVCQDIRPHLKYAKNKRDHFAGRVRNHRVMLL